MAATGLPDFTERLDALFADSRDPVTGRPYSNTAVANALSAYGVSVGGSYLGQLRNGRKSEPGASLVWALAQFFGVTVDYFFGTVVTLDGQELARRLGVLSSGAHIAFDAHALVDAVVAAGQPFDLDSWAGLLAGAGKTQVRQAVLDAIADYFAVPHEYLTDPEPASEEVQLVEAQIDLVNAVAELGSPGPTVRSISESSPAAFRAIAAALRARQS